MREYFLYCILFYGAMLLPNSGFKDTKPTADTAEDTLKLRHKRDANRLTAENCSSKTSFSSIKGVFTTYDIVEYEGSNDEGDNATIVCGINKDVVQKCKDYVNYTLKNASLAINGTIQNGVPSTFDPDTNRTKFSLKLNYHAHLNAKISCFNKLSDQANLTSPTRTITRIDELHKYTITITPNNTDITAGESYNLTCRVDSSRALQNLFWTRKIDDGDETEFKCISGSSCEKRNPPDDPPRQILMISTDNETVKKKTNYTYRCSEKFSSHNNKNVANISVLVYPVDRRLFIALISSGAGIGGAALLIAIGLYVRKRRTMAALKRSIKVVEARNRLMEARQTYNDYDDEARDDPLTLAILTVNDIITRISSRHSSWERDKQSLTITQQIGVGNFGAVFSGTMMDEFGVMQTVAIKTLKPKEQGLDVSVLLEFEKEMDVMTNLRHRNIVELLGICTVSLPFYIILEFMTNGQLNTYLVDFAPSRDEPLGKLSVGQLAWICEQPCDALEYLASRNIVHRDVSARNCLVGSNLQVKLADFGLSRDTSDSAKSYYKKEGGVVPIKWMAPEALTWGRYTSANDIWAFGVLAWEVFSFGAVPYQHLTNQEVVINVCKKGERLTRPHLFPQELWDTILQCWAHEPDERVMFSTVLAFLKEYSQGFTCEQHNENNSIRQ